MSSTPRTDAEWKTFLERELAEEKYQHHLTRGVCDLALKHRDDAERELAEAKALQESETKWALEYFTKWCKAQAQIARLRRVEELARDAVEAGAVDECYLSLLRTALKQ